jgi:membrane protease YdiL (CAAX protease family)
MLREAILIYCGVLGSLKLLHEFRSLPFLNQYLSTIAALTLIYPPVVHVTLRKIPISFFEKNLAAVVSSLFLFVAAALVVMPPFLGLNHLYQRIFFERGLGPLAFDIPYQAILTQLFLVAFPEEFFFRGYLQTVIGRSFHRKIKIFGLKALAVSWAVPITSFLFAASHSFITFQWWHFAIFFPSLVFGWLREKTNGLVAPILFHALCNLLVNWIGMAYR